MLAENPEVGAGYDLRRGINLTYQGIWHLSTEVRLSFYLFLISCERVADPELVGSGHIAGPGSELEHKVFRLRTPIIVDLKQR